MGVSLASSLLSATQDRASSLNRLVKSLPVLVCATHIDIKHCCVVYCAEKNPAHTEGPQPPQQLQVLSRWRLHQHKQQNCHDDINPLHPNAVFQITLVWINNCCFYRTYEGDCKQNFITTISNAPSVSFCSFSERSAPSRNWRSWGKWRRLTISVQRILKSVTTTRILPSRCKWLFNGRTVFYIISFSYSNSKNNQLLTVAAWW